MTVMEYLRTHIRDDYRSRRWRYLLDEIWEMLTAGSWAHMCEEFGDVVHALQLNLVMTTTKDQKLWMWCARKFIRRRRMWDLIHQEAGITQPAKYAGNYQRPEKVINHLARYGVDEAKALEIYAQLKLGK